MTRDNLTLEKFQPIRFSDNPILYILILADTIEPTKTYSDWGMSTEEIWRGIDINFYPDSLVIHVLDERLSFSTMAAKILELNDFIAVHIQVHTKGKRIKITYEL